MAPNSAHPDPMAPVVVLRVEPARRSGPPHVVAVGAVRVEYGEVSEHFQELACPQVPIDAEATALHGIDDEAVRGARPTAQVLADLFAFLGESPWAAHDLERDGTMLAFEATRHGLALPVGPGLDTLALARHFVRDVYEHGLESLADHLGLEPLNHAGGSGEALARAVCAWQVLEACRELGGKESGGDEPLGLRALLALEKPPRGLATFAPRVPALNGNRWRRLERARDRGEPVVLHYGDARQGHTRPARIEVLPGPAFVGRDHDYLEGECLSTGTLKTYRLDRILRVEPLNA